MNKLLDLRFVIGVFFSLVGVLLLIYGFTASATALGTHTVNRACGGFFLAFGVVMILLSLRKEGYDELLEEPPTD